MAATLARTLLVDVHTHVYLPRYVSFLRSRSLVPKIVTKGREERLVILDDEPSGGRPVGPQYWERDEKLAFMDKHGIDISIVSSANPWLDPLSASEATKLAEELNEELEGYCSSSSASTYPGTQHLKRLYGLGLLPIVHQANVSDILAAITQIKSLPHLKGVILGTRGLGVGLDDESLEPVWGSLAESGLVIFLHPHYGVGGGSEWGPKENGHVLPLALGFPMETTVAATRLVLSGVYDRHPNLKILLAHSGGALPLLSSRLSSCVAHDPVVSNRLKHDVRWYLGKMWYDAVAYGSEELEFVSSVADRAHKYGSETANTPGTGQILWGTDHPFFPPISGTAGEKWMSVVENLKAVDEVKSWTTAQKADVLGANALALFGL